MERNVDNGDLVLGLRGEKKDLEIIFEVVYVILW